MQIETHSVAETMALGKKLAEVLPTGSVIALSGDLGAGKTHLAKGIVSGLTGLDPDQIVSPTFTLHSVYTGRQTVHHVDLYRFTHPDEIASLGWDDLLRSGQTLLIEWAEKATQLLPQPRLQISIEHADGRSASSQSRHLSISVVGHSVPLERAVDYTVVGKKASRG